jgi:hypothetical protein
MKHFWVNVLLLVASATGLVAQAQRVREGALQGFSLKFSSNFNRFYRADDNQLLNGWWSTGNLGLGYKLYGSTGHAEFALLAGFKNTTRSLPLVMQDYDGQNGASNQNVQHTFYQAELKVGPRLLKVLYPKFGAVVGYRSAFGGYYDANVKDNDRAPRSWWYFHLPIGLSFDLPTSFGTTGVAVYYEIGLTNTLRGLDATTATRQNALVVELHATLRTN